MTFDHLWAGLALGLRDVGVRHLRPPEESADAQRTGDARELRVLPAPRRRGDADEPYVVYRGPRTAAILNAYPYASGHLLVLPTRHLRRLERARRRGERRAVGDDARRDGGAAARLRARTASTSAPTSDAPPGRACPTTSTSTSCRAGSGTRIS